MAKRKARPRPRSRKDSRFHVTHEEYSRLRDALDELRRESAIQLRRTAEIQADLDEIKRAWQRLKSSS